jgi:hypothetical protein
MARLHFVLPAVVGLALAGAAQAAPTVSGPFTTTGAYNSFLSGIGLDSTNDRQAVGVARIGNNRNGGNFAGGWEAGLFVPAPPTGGIGTAGNTVWTSGSAVPFTFSRAGNNLTFTVGTFYSGTWTDGAVASLDTLGIQASSQATNANIAFNSMTWSDLSFMPPATLVPDETTGGGANGGYVGRVISQIGQGSFSLSGNITLTFDANQLPDAGQLSFRVAAFTAGSGGDPGVTVPTPAALGLFALGLLGLAGIASRRRA